jgi:hypothetical protein
MFKQNNTVVVVVTKDANDAQPQLIRQSDNTAFANVVLTLVFFAVAIATISAIAFGLYLVVDAVFGLVVGISWEAITALWIGVAILKYGPWLIEMWGERRQAKFTRPVVVMMEGRDETKPVGLLSEQRVEVIEVKQFNKQGEKINVR